MAFRGFVAVAVPAEAPLVALLEELAALPADVKPVRPDALHFTLSFLGSTEESSRAPIAEALAEAGRGVAPFRLSLRGVGAFPSARRPRVVWVGVEDPRAVSELATRVRASLAARGILGDDKDFRAHLTLARVRSEDGLDALVQFLKVHGADRLPDVDVHEVRLYKSTLSSLGPAYEPLERAPLEA